MQHNWIKTLYYAERAVEVIKKKDYIWKLNGEYYIIRNIPFYVSENAEDSVDASVALKVATLKELMTENKIPKDIDFEKMKDVEY